MAKMIYQTKVIMARDKDSFETQLNQFLSTLDPDSYLGVQYQESSGTFSAIAHLKNRSKLIRRWL
jgi:hypothetical protein